MQSRWELWVALAVAVALCIDAKRTAYRDLKISREFDFTYSHQGKRYGSAIPRALVIIENTLFGLTIPDAGDEIHIVGFNPEGLYNGKLFVVNFGDMVFPVSREYGSKNRFGREHLYACGIAENDKGNILVSISFIDRGISEDGGNVFNKYFITLSSQNGDLLFGPDLVADPIVPAGVVYDEESNLYLVTQYGGPEGDTDSLASMRSMIYGVEPLCIPQLNVKKGKDAGDSDMKQRCEVVMRAAYDLQYGLTSDGGIEARVAKEISLSSQPGATIEQPEKVQSRKRRSKEEPERYKRKLEEVALSIPKLAFPVDIGLHPKTRNLFVLAHSKHALGEPLYEGGMYLLEISPRHKLIDFWDLHSIFGSSSANVTVNGVAVTEHYVYLAVYTSSSSTGTVAFIPL